MDIWTAFGWVSKQQLIELFKFVDSFFFVTQLMITNSRNIGNCCVLITLHSANETVSSMLLFFNTINRHYWTTKNYRKCCALRGLFTLSIHFKHEFDLPVEPFLIWANGVFFSFFSRRLRILCGKWYINVDSARIQAETGPKGFEKLRLFLWNLC